MIALATVKTQIGDYLSALIVVYLVVLLAYLVINLLLSFGARPPYNRATDAILTFLRDCSEPYLRVFRRIIPPLGPLDLSPMLAIFLLIFLNRIVASIFNG